MLIFSTVIHAQIFFEQLEVKNIHLRYEDDQTLPGNPFACGVTIKSLSAKSTDKDWVIAHILNNGME